MGFTSKSATHAGLSNIFEKLYFLNTNNTVYKIETETAMLLSKQIWIGPPHVHLYIIESRMNTHSLKLFSCRYLFPWHQLAPFCQLLLASLQNNCVLLNAVFVDTLFGVLFRTLSNRSQIFFPWLIPKIIQ